jgi:hypothetical protein
VDAVFMAVDRTFNRAKKNALRRAYEAVGRTQLTPMEKAYLLADHYDLMGMHNVAEAWRKNIKVGLIDVSAVEKQWEQING